MTFTDQMGRKVALLNWPPRRIVSLVPSQTELLFELGLGDRVVGITKFCVHPTAWFKSKTRIGGTKTVDFDRVRALEPDLILGNKEENDQAQIEQLAGHFPVWMSDISTLEQALDMMDQVGFLTDTRARSTEILQKIKADFADLKTLFPPKKAAYFIWRKPFMVVGGGTFIDDLLQKAGFLNVFGQHPRYPTVSESQILAAQPEVILLSNEPFPFADRHVAAFKKICPSAEILIVDGELFSWYGARLLASAAYFETLQSSSKNGSAAQ